MQFCLGYVTPYLHDALTDRCQRRSTRMTSQAFHGLGFYWARQCELLVTRPFSQVPSLSSPMEIKHQQWETWAAQETRHRAVLGHYILDGLISQTSGLPTSDRHMTNTMILPSSTKAYEALSADAWIQAMEEEPQTTMPFCHIYMRLFDPAAALDYQLSPFAIRVVLEGLQSLISDHRQAHGLFVGAKDLASISSAMWQVLDKQIESSLHPADQRVDLSLRWHAICIDLCVNTNLLIRHLCEAHSVEQDLYNSKSRADFDVSSWLNTREARRAILHASAIARLVMDYPLRRLHSIHVPFAVMTSCTIFLAAMLSGKLSAAVPEVIDWQIACLSDTRNFQQPPTPVEKFLDSSEDVWNSANNGRNLLYGLNALQTVLGSLSTTWGIAIDMQAVVARLASSVV